MTRVGTLALAMQSDEVATDPIPGLHRRGAAPMPAQRPEAETFAMPG